MSILQNRIVRMPEFVGSEWLNAPMPPPRRAQLRGRVALVAFWDYTCINCVRTLPYLVRWHERYADLGLTIIGVHTPEFKFARMTNAVQTAVTQYALPFPILLDNQYKNWEQFTVKAWPTRFLVDPDGYIRYKAQGEGYYQETEQAIQLLLKRHNPDLVLPDLLPPLREEDTPGAVCYRPQAEVYAGYQGGGLFGGGLGNQSGYAPNNPVFYELPQEREDGHFYLDGVWQAWPEAVAYVGEVGGQVVLPYQSAATVNAVLALSADEVALRLGLTQENGGMVEVKANGRYLSRYNAGQDVEFTNDGLSYIRIREPRLYQLVRHNEWGSTTANELSLTFRTQGMALFSFSFTTCVAPIAGDNDDLIQIH